MTPFVTPARAIREDTRSILVSGASGMVGTALVPWLISRGHRVTRLVRRSPRDAGEISWDPAASRIDWPGPMHFDAVVNLSGVNVAEGRWTAARKAAILASRLDATTTLVTALGELANPPAVLVNASAVGFYGDREDEKVDEREPAGTGFLAEVCRAWETAADAATVPGLHVVKLRTGVVLGEKGGALAKLLPVFRLGLGGRLGDGRQWMSWISIDDLLRIIEQACLDPVMSGPVNAVAPQPVTNREFTAAMSSVLARPAVLPVPAFALRAIYGQMAEEALLAGTRAVPARLQELGFVFQHPEIRAALAAVLGRGKG